MTQGQVHCDFSSINGRVIGYPSQSCVKSWSFEDTMGCVGSSEKQLEGRHKKLKRPKPWKNLEPITRAQVKRMRDEFWDTAPHYGGQKEIWDALRAASEADIGLARAIVDSAGVIVTSEDLSTCYDERGAKYELPKYVLSEPTNILKDN
ncbi:hypothetical protein O6H91_02G075300 [Diphasiastrum complanatum]|uniref:Uncharacterized protein n=1 Tax=Diphasiastrum complanatum TaxID=34168 RepID=A0ACC2EH78_DIPCM|nr:hypothetical protein O6H91_02G075300 [Diphasiastrum complanatum]